MRAGPLSYAALTLARIAARSAIQTGANLATGNKIGLAQQIFSFLRRRGYSERELNSIGDILLSEPEEGLNALGVARKTAVKAE